ncbi:MAG: transcriptional regulator NrdR [Myxococcota bacterium]|nr:transcriptional regulator NrdR [Myxococcota bacterium]
MKCPVCSASDTRVIDSRSAKDDSEIRRRRLCDACTHRFTTYERAERLMPLVVKKDGRREEWQRDKVLQGVTKACEKRPISIEAIERMVDKVAEELSGGGEVEISSQVIGKRLMDKLHELDEVAYVRFASVYRSFKDIDEFMTELADLIKDRGGGRS